MNVKNWIQKYIYWELELFKHLGYDLELKNLVDKKIIDNKLEYISKGHSRDFIHVRDVCEVIYKLSKKTLPVKTFDLGSGVSLNLKDIAPSISEKEALPYELKSNDCDPTEVLNITNHVLKHNPKEYFNV